VSGDEDDREWDTRRSEIALKIESTSSWQSHVHHQSGRPIAELRLEKVIDGCKEQRVQAHGPEESTERLAESQIVVDDDYAGILARYQTGSWSKVHETAPLARCGLSARVHGSLVRASTLG